MMHTAAAVAASAAEWQIQSASAPNTAGSTAANAGVNTALRMRDAASARAVLPVACQKVIIRMLKPANVKPQKYTALRSEAKAVSSGSPGLKTE